MPAIDTEETTMPTQATLDELLPATDLTAYPDSAVPASFDRGHLFSPDLRATETLREGPYYDLDGHLWDYRPGNDFEPLPPAPRLPNDKAPYGRGFGWWFYNEAKIPAADFLGLRVGDVLSIQWPTCVIPGAVVLETFRFGALVRFRNGDIVNDEKYVRRRNPFGHWY